MSVPTAIGARGDSRMWGAYPKLGVNRKSTADKPSLMTPKRLPGTLL
jgi:hypothetical protein